MATSTSTPAVTVGEAVHFRYRDPIFGTQLDQSGIVVSVTDGLAAIAPVSSWTVLVDVDDVEPLVSGS